MSRRTVSPAPLDGRGRNRGTDGLRLVLRVTAAGLLVATGAIHLDLYLTGYRTIPTIGWLFLLQVIAAFGLGATVIVARNRLVAAAAAGFAIATLGGYLLSLRIGLFGFREVRTAAGVVAGVVEVSAFAALAAVVLSPRAEDQPEGPGPHHGTVRNRLRAAVPAGRWGAGALTVLAAVLLGLAVAATGPPPTGASSSRVLLETVKIHGVAVLTDARGFTLYRFAPDMPDKSTCFGTCAAYWPPVIGRPIAGRGVTGRLGTTTRPGGAPQVTYDRHPLYTYVGDSAPGQANGNNIDLNGGLWYEIPVPG